MAAMVEEESQGPRDEEEVWLEGATEEDLERHAERVSELFERYGISPASSPSVSGTSSPAPEEEYREEPESSDTGDKRPTVAPSRGLEVQLRHHQEQALRHRRNSSLITTIVSQESREASRSAVPEMRSTLFSKTLRKQVQSAIEPTEGSSGSRTPSMLPEPPRGEPGAGLGLDAERPMDPEPANRSEEAGSDLVSPFLDSLYEAERSELSWLRPRRGSAPAEPPETPNPTTAESGGEDAMSVGGMAISRNSWLGTLDLDAGPEDGSPIIASSRTLPDDSGVLAVGTGTGVVLVRVVSDLSSPRGTPTLRCEPPPPAGPQEKNLKVTCLATSFGADDYVAVGYSTGAVALYDTSDLTEAQRGETVSCQPVKVIRQPETKDVAVTSLAFTFCRQVSGEGAEAADQGRQKSLRGTAKAAIGAMGMGKVCSFLACSANGLVCSHSISVVAPAVSFLRRAPVLSVSTKIRGRLESGILDCSAFVSQAGVLAAIVLQNSITVVQLPLSENQENAQMATLGKVSKPASGGFGAVPCVCWRMVGPLPNALELLVSWDCIAQSVSVKPTTGSEIEGGESLVHVVHEWRLEQAVASMHWLEHSGMLAICSEHGHVALSACQAGTYHQGLQVVESIFLQDSPARQAAVHERSFRGSTASISSLEFPYATPEASHETTMQGQAALSIVCNNGKMVYILLLSPLSRAIALFSKNVATPERALRSSLDMLASGCIAENRDGLIKQILVTLDATMRKEIHEEKYDVAAKTTFSACLEIAESQVKCNDISMLDDSVAIRDFLWQDAFSAFSENESSISAFTRALEEAIMKQVGAGGGNLPGSETIRVPPEVMQKLVESLSAHPERIERCVIQMPIFCLDFNQVAKLCILHNLHTAFAYLYNEGLKDALTPAIEMIRGLLKCETTEAQVNLMRKLSVYVGYCFQGMRYPPVDQSKTLNIGRSVGSQNEPLTDLVQKEEQLHTVRAQLLKLLLLCPVRDLLQPGMATPLLNSEDILSGPVVRLLLRVNSFLSLSMLLCAFEVWDAASADILEANVLQHTSGSPIQGNPDGSTALQLTVDVLSQEAEECERMGSEGMACAGCVWMFIAHEVASGRARLGSSTGAQLLARVLEHLCLAASTIQDLKRRESFERAALRLVDEWWDINCSPDLAERIGTLALNTKLYLLCAKVQMLCGDYGKAVDFTLKYINELDRDGVHGDEKEVSAIRHRRCEAIFKMLNDLLSIEGKGRAEARQAVTSKLKDFTRIDGNRTAHLIGTIQSSTGDGDGLGGQVQNRAEDLENKLLTENYIEAICQIDPDAVLSYLQRNEGNYRLDAVLQVIMNFAAEGTFTCDDAAVYLLERLGDIGGGLDIILRVVRTGLALLLAKLTESEGRGNIHLILEGRATRECLRAAFELNFRNSQLLDAPEREELWFKILATFVNPAHDAALAAPAATTGSKQVLKEMQSFLSTCMRDTITAMSAAMPLTRVAARLVQEHSGSTLSSFREILSDLLQACGHEVDVLATAKRVFDSQQCSSRLAKWAISKGSVNRKELRISEREEGVRRKGTSSWLNNVSPAMFSSAESQHLHLQLAPPPGSELVALGPIAPSSSMRVVGAFPSEAKFSGSG